MRRLLLVFAACALGWATGCSGGGSGTVVTPPTSGFTNASLKGTYVFSVSGTTADPNLGIDDEFARVGIFIADGLGNIAATGGIEDVHKFGEHNQYGFTGGSYNINSDGRGTLCVETSGGNVQYSISLAASSNGYMADMGGVSGCSSGATFSGGETGSGSFTLQTATTLATGTYIFDFSGIAPDDTGNAASIVGDFIPNSGTGSGSFSAGSYEDVNEGGIFSTKASISGGSFATDNTNPGTGRGLATIGGVEYVYYVIDSQHVQFMGTAEDESAPGTLAGEAIAQQIGVPNQTSAFNSSSFVFVMGGSDLSSGGPFTRGARFTATGGSVASILLDENDAGSFQSVPTTGVLSGGTITLDGDNSGRGTLTFADTVNHTGTYSFVFYLSSATQGVIQDVTTVGATATPVDVMDGTLLAQTGAPFTSGGLATAYSFDWSGANGNGEEDFVGSFAPANAAPNGLVDYNEFGVGKLFLNTPFNGVFTISGDGTSSTGSHSAFVAGLTGTPNVNINYFAYIANPSTILIMGTQNGGTRVIAGVLTAQNP